MDDRMFVQRTEAGERKESIGLVGHMMTVSSMLGFLGVVIDKRVFRLDAMWRGVVRGS